MDKLKQLLARIDALTVRERAIVFVGLIAILFSIWDAMLTAPLANRQNTLNLQLNSKNAERLALNTRLQQMIVDGSKDPNAAKLVQLKTLRSKLVEVEAELDSSTTNLVSPQEMPRILENVLRRSGDLTLLSMKSLGVRPLLEKEEDGADVNETGAKRSSKALTSDNITNAYKHGLRLEFEGNYFSTINYLKSLEQLEWSFFWDNFKLDVIDYPDTRASIEIFTLSLAQDFIGV